jgi:catechol 2,3-dioxygenase-like lactoylglutathione lyase family enzyme
MTTTPSASAGSAASRHTPMQALDMQATDMQAPGRHNLTHAVPVLGLHHFAWRCRDSEETRRFYEDLLGLPLVHVIKSDHVPSTGEYCPYVHIFFQMRDGSYIAFFDLGDNIQAEPSPNTPAWVNHIALRVESVAALLAAKARLEAAGVEVLGVTDHHIIESIYFFDPNGIRVELTTPTVPQSEMDAHALHARADLDEWTARKAARMAGQGAHV